MVSESSLFLLLINARIWNFAASLKSTSKQFNIGWTPDRCPMNAPALEITRFSFRSLVEWLACHIGPELQQFTAALCVWNFKLLYVCKVTHGVIHAWGICTNMRWYLAHIVTCTWHMDTWDQHWVSSSPIMFHIYLLRQVLSLTLKFIVWLGWLANDLHESISTYAPGLGYRHQWPHSAVYVLSIQLMSSLLLRKLLANSHLTRP